MWSVLDRFLRLLPMAYYTAAETRLVSCLYRYRISCVCVRVCLCIATCVKEGGGETHCATVTDVLSVALLSESLKLPNIAIVEWHRKRPCNKVSLLYMESLTHFRIQKVPAE